MCAKCTHVHLHKHTHTCMHIAQYYSQNTGVVIDDESHLHMIEKNL